MDEIDTLIDAYTKNLKNNPAVVLATLIHVEGSHYRHPGATVLFTDEEVIAGTISGGCMEKDLQTYVRMVWQDQVPRIVTYDTTTEEDLLWGLNLGCGGKVEVFLEPLIPGDSTNPLEFIQRCRFNSQEGVLATVVATESELLPLVGERILFCGEEIVIGNTFPNELTAKLTQGVKSVLVNRKNTLVDFTTSQGKLTIWFNYIPLPVQVLVCGAGEDALPLVHLLDDMGWRVFLADPRPSVATADVFPGIHEFIITPYDQLPTRVDFNRINAVVILTHNYQYDGQLLGIFFDTKIPYIGLLGSRQRTKKLLAELKEKRGEITATERHRLHAPVGLDIQAETPQEIALSIVAEIVSVLKGGAIRDITRKKLSPV